MKRKLSTFVWLIMATCMLSSCLNDSDEEVTYYNDTAVTAFTLGTVKRFLHTTSSKGADSIYKSPVTGSNYTFVIDQATRQIYNPDSLPFACENNAILATISTKNSGSVALVSTSSTGTDSLSYYSSSDSINFAKINKLRVYNLSGSAYSEYSVKVNIHQQKIGVFNWADSVKSTIISSFEDVKALSKADQVFAFALQNGATKVYATSNTNLDGWSEVSSASFSADAYKSAILANDNFYILSNGEIYSSANGADWTVVGSNSSIKQLLGFSVDRCFAITNNKSIVSSKDGCVSWTDETLASDKENMPTENLNLVSFPVKSIANAELATLIGMRSASYGDESNVVWNKLIENSADAENQPWTYSAYSASDLAKTPWLDKFIAVKYNDRIEALGSNQIVYKSSDNGLTWAKDTVVTMPTEFNSNRFGFVADSNNFLWLIDTKSGYVLKGRHNEAGWLRRSSKDD